jgi:uncharacterized protein
MLLDLSKLHGPREHFERVFQPSVFDPPDEDYRVAAPVELSIDVERSGPDSFRVRGRVATKLELLCGRCLETFELPVDAQFDLRYIPHVGDAKDAEREIAEDDLTTSVYRDGTLDLLDLLREQFLLVLPMKPLCAQSCRGLCPDCGANLNASDCSCQPRWEDPRLAPLKGLLNRDKES